MRTAEWVDRVFGNAGSYFDWPDEAYTLAEPSAETAKLLTELFRSPADLLAAVPDDVIGEAFWFFGSHSFRLLHEGSIDRAARIELIRSFETLFRDLVAVRCAESLGYMSETHGKLNTAAYMWWDFDCWAAGSELDAEYLDAMARMLRIRHAACQESALHGLGHWARAHPARVQAEIDAFLASGECRRSELTRYAASARCGCIL